MAHGLVESGQGRCLPILSSALAREILTRGYDARNLARVYANVPTPERGLLGSVADRMVLELPIHRGLRERLEAATGELTAAAVMQIRSGERECRVLSTPCGLGCELTGMLERLRATRPEVAGRVRCWGVDLDPEGTVLPEASWNARCAGHAITFLQEDLRRHRGVTAIAAQEGPFHAVLSLGLTQQLSLEELAQEIRFFTGIMAPGATLILDRWEKLDRSGLAGGLSARIPCYSTGQFHPVLREAGLTVEREHATGEGGCVLVVARKPD